jgi:hypothetical protein
LQFINTGSYKQMTFKEYVNGLEKVM